MKDQKTYGFSTEAIHAGEEPDLREGSAANVVSPIHLSTTFAWKSPGEPCSEFEYTRTSNPTRRSYETKLASLENAGYALAFASGMAAETAVLQAMIRPGDHIVAFDDLYGGTRRLFEEVFHGLEVSYVDLSETDNFRSAIRRETRMVWVESPTNPLLKIADIKAISSLAKDRGILTVVDNTFLTPYFQKPLELGADIVIHSTTKYVGGHSDSLGGAVVVSDDKLHEKIAAIQNNAGAVLSPFDSYLNLRGLKTLSLRMERHQENAMRIADYLDKHPSVSKVYYPGLASHPGHEVIKNQARGFGGVVSFEIKGDIGTAKTFLDNVKLFTLAESLGGVESLIELPALMTHASLSAEVREQIGIKDTLIRVSVGIEDADDLIADLGQAFGSLPDRQY